MAEPEGTAGVDATGEIEAPIDVESTQELDQVAESDGEEAVAGGADAAGPEDAGQTEDGVEGAAPKPAEPPRRRLVSELLEGQEAFEESSRPGLQLVAPPLHLETIDAGQPIYQLDLSSDEPQGVLVEPERPAVSPRDEIVAQGTASPSVPLEGSAREIVKALIMRRDRQVMAAERDGIGAYELAVGLDAFVQRILEVARTSD
jgi:hypothetical protein